MDRWQAVTQRRLHGIAEKNKNDESARRRSCDSQGNKRSSSSIFGTETRTRSSEDADTCAIENIGGHERRRCVRSIATLRESALVLHSSPALSRRRARA
eukprot:6212313-Pleurochrysis_carterae.AAC.1